LCLPTNRAGQYEGATAFSSLKKVFQQSFQNRCNLVCIMAAGIVVRSIAPFLQGKDQDPAVVVVDEGGRFAISLLSGHLGGANELAREVAAIIGGTPVITTATDVQGLPAFDVLAPKLGLRIENLSGVRLIHMALLAGEPIQLVDKDGWLSEALAGYDNGLFIEEEDLETALTRSNPTVYVGERERSWPERWLRLRPRSLVLGMGCNKGTETAEILELIRRTFEQEGLSLSSIQALATIAAKKEEPGLLEAAQRLGVELLWFTAEELQEIDVPNPSAVVARHMGVSSVCEAAALRAARTGQLLIPKCKTANVTLAVARAV